jgi:hypothetical protein
MLTQRLGMHTERLSKLTQRQSMLTQRLGMHTERLSKPTQRLRMLTERPGKVWLTGWIFLD